MRHPRNRFGWRSRLWVALVLGALAYGIAPPRAAVVSYDIVYVRAPRFGNEGRTRWPEAGRPAFLDPGADLMLLHPDGSEEVLVAGGLGAVTDPSISFDGQWCYYSYFPNMQADQLRSGNLLPRQGADIYRIHLRTRQIERLTNQEFTPNTGSGNWFSNAAGGGGSAFNYLGYGVMNLGATPVSGGRIAFVSNRNGFIPTSEFTYPTFQLYVMDDDGQNVTPIAPMTIGSALHPMQLRDGRLMFSSYESQGLRDSRVWGMWAINPDGRNWAPLLSAFHQAHVLHFATQLSGGDVVVGNYYNLNSSGFGTYLRFPVTPATPAFTGPTSAGNPRIAYTEDVGRLSYWIPFSPIGLTTITPFTTHGDGAAPPGTDGQRVGKFQHPSAAPGGDMLTVWTPGPANSLERPTSKPTYDGGLYIIPGGNTVNRPSDLVLIKNDPRYNEVWPRAVVSYRAIYGINEPAQLPWLPNDGTAHPELPAGTPYGIIGTSSFYKRQSFPGNKSTPGPYRGLDVFNTTANEESSNWLWQGSDSGLYSNDEIFAVRIVALEPNSDRALGPNAGQHFTNHANERMRILGEIPLRKFDAGGRPILDPEGNPDTSFAAKIPADTPFTFQMIDRDGMLLTMAQTWHQVRPGEVRTDCGGCHAHSQQPLPFSSTAAGQPGYRLVDLTKGVPLLTSSAASRTTRTVNAGVVDVEFYRDIRPILQRSCVSCHTRTASTPPGNLVLDDTTLTDGLPGDYLRLAQDRDARWGYPPLVRVSGRPTWRQFNASRYIRKFQGRRSLLMWKILGRRTDGFTNADHPTESMPGDAATLPAGGSINLADLDYTGTMMPPPGSGVPPLSDEDKLTIARWIDMGAPIDRATGTANAGKGWFLDEIRPTLTVSAPRPNLNAGTLTQIRVGVADANTGIAPGSLSVTVNVPLAGLPADTELTTLGSFVGDGVFSIRLPSAVVSLGNAVLTARVRDLQGNETVEQVRFSVGSSLRSVSAVETEPQPAPAPASAPASSPVSRATTPVMPGSLIVKFADGVPPAEREAIAASTGGALLARPAYADFDLIAIEPADDPAPIIAALEGRPDVTFVQRRYRLSPAQTRTAATPASRPAIAAEQWPAGSGAPQVIALLDTGTTTAGAIGKYRASAWSLPPDVFPALGTVDVPFAVAPTLAKPGLFVSPRDFIWNSTTPVDLDGHGTFLASTLRQLTARADAAVPGVRLMPVKVLESTWDRVFGSPVSGTDDVLARGIRYAVDHGATVLNISVGRTGPPSPVVAAALRDAAARGVFVAIAAGNRFEDGNPPDAIASIAQGIEGVMAVGAAGADGRRAPYSTVHPYVELLAPGGAQQVSYDRGFIGPRSGSGRYGAPRFDVFRVEPLDGTSTAAAHVAALAAMLRRSGLSSPDAIESLLKRSALANGLIDPPAAFTAIRR